MKSMAFMMITPFPFTWTGTSSPTGMSFLNPSFTFRNGLASCSALSGSSILYADWM